MAFLDGVWHSWMRHLSKVAFRDMTFVDARRKQHALKVGARSSSMTCISVLSSHDCFAFNNCITVATEDKVESFFREEEDKDAGAKEREEDASNDNADKLVSKDGEAFITGRCTGMRTHLGSSQGGARTQA